MVDDPTISVKMQLPNTRTVLTKLWTSKGINLPSQVLESVTLKLPSGLDKDGPELKVGEQSLKSSFRIGVASQATITAVTLASAFLYELRLEVQKKKSEKKKQNESDGEESKSEEAIKQEVQQLIEKCSERIPIITVSARHSVLEFASEKHTRVYRGDSSANSTTSTSKASTSSTSDQQSNSIHFLDPRAKQILEIPEDAVGDWDPLAGIYETKPQGKRQFIRLHTNFPHHKRGLLGILGLLPLASGENRTSSSYASSTKRETSITREMVQKVLRSWHALEFETVAREKGLCATMLRSEKDWEESEMGKSVRKAVEELEGPVSVQRIEEENGSSSEIKTAVRSQSSSSTTAESVQDESNERCLASGFGDVGNGDAGRALRIVDLSRVIAAPVAARTLAAHGASVLLLSSPLNPHLPNLELDTARGKRTAYLDLDSVKVDPNTYDPDTYAPKIESYPGREQFKDLVKNADVVLQAYRPSGLASRGLSPEALQEVRPGIVFASLSAYGPTGPWSEARGFDSLTQTACGMNHSESLSFEAFKRGVDVEDLEVDLQVEPRALPVQALDHSAGYLLAFGILSAKIHQSLLELKYLISTEAHSISPSSRVGFKVTLSLATTATWLKDLGRISGKEAWETPQSVEPQSEEVRSLLEPTRIRGEDEIVLFGMQHSGKIEGRRVGWKESPNGLGGDKVEWVQ